MNKRGKDIGSLCNPTLEIVEVIPSWIIWWGLAIVFSFFRGIPISCSVIKAILGMLGPILYLLASDIIAKLSGFVDRLYVQDVSTVM